MFEFLNIIKRGCVYTSVLCLASKKALIIKHRLDRASLLECLHTLYETEKPNDVFMN